MGTSGALRGSHWGKSVGFARREGRRRNSGDKQRAEAKGKGSRVVHMRAFWLSPFFKKMRAYLYTKKNEDKNIKGTHGDRMGSTAWLGGTTLGMCFVYFLFLTRLDTHSHGFAEARGQSALLLCNSRSRAPCRPGGHPAKRGPGLRTAGVGERDNRPYFCCVRVVWGGGMQEGCEGGKIARGHQGEGFRGGKKEEEHYRPAVTARPGWHGRPESDSSKERTLVAH